MDSAFRGSSNVTRKIQDKMMQMQKLFQAVREEMVKQRKEKLTTKKQKRKAEPLDR